ncbi:MAG: hypothetical protein KUG49_00510 [Dokdonia sp.]|nr:hypothetical protein [Dokdonia sp.]
MSVSILKKTLLGILGLGASGIALSFGFQSFIGLYAVFTSDYNAYEQGRLGVLLFVAIAVCLLSAWVAFWAFRKMTTPLPN